jgi:aminomethyltransferase
VTSGTHSPMLGIGIGMAYVPTALSQPESEITIDVRGTPRRAHVVAKPIYKRREA